ncbi:MAG: biotin transporter BioY [Candidatus Omnitrophota bacterium]|nr:biotin transporter BioY [Candidatus Omnitrophota bacterium]MBU1928236.1 biotin transporter BioY [Candidatus Omnitrophota bacterium]MBU2034426.1 biotin transporter BioY [Candidatus Omnitrophota bacterium]MBU2258611.1 biotin transporter BioY [Candidatus Omnitrophota bacterium]
MMEAILRREIVVNKSACRIIGVVTFVILISLGAFVRIPLPFTPVPITLQTFFVLLSGAVLGGALGAASQMGYLLLGTSGLPIFTNAGYGIAHLLGPTGGYILGFIFSSMFIAKYVRSSRNFLSVVLVFCLGDFIILSCGVIWLKVILGYSLPKLLLIGFLPFIPGDLAKALAAALVYLRVKNRVRKIF